MSTELQNQIIRQARKKFTAIAGAFSFGVFNDNFYKQAVLILAVAIGNTSMQGYALAVFTFPFLLFAAPAGWLSDRFAKRQVIISCKWLELAAMVLGAAGVMTDCWPLIFGMLAVMGFQATLFSPALNGSIPELYPADYVIRANAFLRMASTSAILLGIALAGMILDRPGYILGIEAGRYYVGVTVLGVALAGLFLSYGAPFKPPASVARSFPWSGPWHTLKSLREIARDKLLITGLAADVFIWFAGSIQILIINPLGIQQFQLSKTATSLLIVTQLVGIIIGGLASSKLVTPERWHRFLPASGIGMGLILILTAAVPILPPALILPALYSAIALTGLFGGLFLIPVESFLQIRADPTKKGEVWATANFAVFTGILLSGPLSNVMNACWAPTSSLGIIGVFTLAVSLALWFVFRRIDWSS
ncbi:MAG: MFS transporter [Verrucomicrobia bacterium]|nr:MFS transporter [Verrucomicrobiota bacterium]MCG2680829.1 MFS transporter [Kiritimatiellia bacterium]MBU4246838.1 MFS transporter [Verrucomicrobiota bacterium]MBU4290416.1 MFS transporter [Verrucomicrobiota bacterium]MBU4429921.1 MFS transporter [Verrucomicrobiota bacterium]